MHESILFSIFLIFTGAALVAAAALFARQSLLVANILLGGDMGMANRYVFSRGTMGIP